MTQEAILQERLERIRAIVDVLEQRGELDLTVLTQFRQALNWAPSAADESQVYGNDCPGGRCEF